MLKPNLILCLGNDIISDDGFGPAVAKRFFDRLDLDGNTEVISACVAGFHLLQLLVNRRRVLIVDTIRTGKALPGTLHEFPAGVFTPSHSLTTSHQISLPTALELGKRLGLNMPVSIDVLAVEAEDLETLSECLTPAVQGAVEQACDRVSHWISSENNYGEMHADRTEAGGTITA